jgi:hypothetical protein
MLIEIQDMPRRGYRFVENDLENGFCPVAGYPIAHLKIICARVRMMTGFKKGAVVI